MNIGVISNLLKENSINNNKLLGNSLEKLSTGFKINKSSDNASGLAISDKLRTQASGIKQGIDNANSAIALTQIADKSMGEISNILDTVKAKLIQAHTNTTSEDGRISIKKDIEKLLTQIESIAEQTNYNGTKLLSHEGLEFQVGDKSSDIIPLKKMDINLDSLSGVGDSGIDYSKVNVNDLEGYTYIQDEYYSLYSDESQVIFTKNDMLKDNDDIPITDNINDILVNDWLIYLSGSFSIEMEVNSNNFQLSSTTVYENIYSKILLLDTDDGIIIPEDESTKEYFERYISYNSLSGMVNYVQDGNNGDVGYGYFEFGFGDGFWSPNDEQYYNDDIITKNQILKFSTSNADFNFSLFNIQINKIEIHGIGNIDLRHFYYVNPDDIQPNSPTITCGTLQDLKNISHEDFTFDCAGSFQPVVDFAISKLNNYRSEVGSTQNQLESSVRNNMTNYVNIKNAESIIRDIDYAQESANFNKSNIISQSGSYVQAQANEIDKNYVLSLLK